MMYRKLFTILGILLFAGSNGAAAQSFQRTVLLEHFTSLPCVNCPEADRRLEAIVSQRSDVVWVSHHVGYADDEFTLDASQAMVRYGVGGNPYMMLDRTTLEGFGAPAFTISDMNDQVLQAVFNYKSQQAAPLQLHATAAVQADGTLAISIDGEANGQVHQEHPRATLHIYLVEDDVTAVAAQAGDATKKQHDNILRTFVTGQRGVLPEWGADDTTFAYATTTALDNAWNTGNLRIVAFLATSAPTGTNYPTGQVLNATQTRLGSASAISTVTAGRQQAPRVCFDLSGRRLPTSAPRTASGVRIVRQGGTVRKVIQ